MTVAARRRGEPLLLLGLVVGTWVGGRALSWQPPAALLSPPFAAFAALPQEEASAAVPNRHRNAAPRPTVYVSPARLTAARLAPLGGLGPWQAAFARPPQTSRVSAAHQLLLVAGLGYATLPEAERRGRSHMARPAVAPFALAGQSGERGSRWSGDGWVLLRGGSYPSAAAGGSAGYGGSQAGAVLRYRLAPRSRFRPAAFVRVSGALGHGGEREAAFGLMARPVPTLPFALLAEGRVQQGGSGTVVRPAVAVFSELPEVKLPLGSRLEAYGQAGYVGGRQATGFYDAQVAIDRPLTGAVRVGAGAWAGGQKGANRLDVGPRAAVRFELGGIAGRVSADWRFRVSGNAAPGSGPAVTLSAGF
jgi:hypothetical protein